MVADLINRIEKKRGRAVANRLYQGMKDEWKRRQENDW